LHSLTRLWGLNSPPHPLARLLPLDLLDGLQNPAPNDRTVYISRLQKAISRFTTFSSFSPQGPNLALDGQWMPASFYIVGSVLLCLIGVWLGHGLGIAINR
jgi:hypothetical protein